MLTTLFATSKTTNGDKIETIKFGKKTARLLPIQISIGFSGVDKRDEIIPFAFSLVNVPLVKNGMLITSGISVSIKRILEIIVQEIALEEISSRSGNNQLIETTAAAVRTRNISKRIL
ncbi:hypothetical protein V9W62_03560 [Bacillus velezensis]|uniref:hypothetical protein n=1 Tax=Bacillus velezensis TaxID=492670 RepID=UPI0005B656DC|nr:hypothetical protein [Bacillus velezensis]AWK45268.1 hypothetical protein RZ52_03495 [Bacillus velezensis]